MERIAGLAENPTPLALICREGSGRPSSTAVKSSNRLELTAGPPAATNSPPRVYISSANSPKSSGRDYERMCFAYNTTTALPTSSNFHPPRRCPRTLAHVPEGSPGPLSSSLRVSTRTTSAGCSPSFPTAQTCSTTSVFSFWYIKAMDSLQCRHPSVTIFVPKIPYHLHSSAQSKAATSTDCRFMSIPAGPALERRDRSSRKMRPWSTYLTSLYPSTQTRSMPGTPVLIS